MLDAPKTKSKQGCAEDLEFPRVLMKKHVEITGINQDESGIFWF